MHICKSSSTGSQQVMSLIPPATSMGTVSSDDHDYTVNAKDGMSAVESFFLIVSLIFSTFLILLSCIISSKLFEVTFQLCYWVDLYALALGYISLERALFSKRVELHRQNTLASHQGEPCSIPGRVTPGFPHAVIVSDDAAGRGSPISAALSFRHCFIRTSFHSHRLSRRRCKDLPINISQWGAHALNLSQSIITSTKANYAQRELNAVTSPAPYQGFNIYPLAVVDSWQRSRWRTLVGRRRRTTSCGLLV
ncbi:hypothetical protein PR048_026399 [Dryococelus australis]|uniref:Uncharacterized protein n=1 Tax=Dryococelus australis TaxID=614101 RepID=A0ABQ9GLA1_9NEOP|nr:hypothetical protein PR048_026399 [Dryococelus australis]